MTTMIIHLHQGQVVVKIHLLQTMKMMTTLPVQRREIIHHLIKKAVAVKANHHQIMRQEEWEKERTEAKEDNIHYINLEEKKKLQMISEDSKQVFMAS